LLWDMLKVILFISKLLFHFNHKIKCQAQRNVDYC